MKYNWEQFSEGKTESSLVHSQLLVALEKLPDKTIIRYGDIGDLPGDGTRVFPDHLLDIADVCQKKNHTIWTYTHYLSENNNYRTQLSNGAAIISALKKDFCINVSTESVAVATRRMAGMLPTTLVVANPKDADKKFWAKNKYKVIDDIRYMVCPAVYSDTQCKTCGGKKGPFCAQRDRKSVICFPAHGARTSKVNSAVENIFGE